MELNELDENQKQAVMCNLNPTLVIAGPGSGKTRVLTNRIQYMIDELKCPSQKILVVTFTKRAAEEMEKRFKNIYKDSKVTFGTLHSAFLNILKRTQPIENKLLLGNDQLRTLRKLLKNMGVYKTKEFIRKFISEMSLMKNQLIAPKDYIPENINPYLFFELLNQYENYKKEHKYIDFDDILVDCYLLLKNNPQLCKEVSEQYHYILVDEFQDVNRVQFEVLKLIAQEHRHLFVVGDDDQSIYSFRGAKPEYLLNFKNYFPDAQTYYLNTNYRCSGAILKDSLLIINQNQQRFIKPLKAFKAIGKRPRLIDCDNQSTEAHCIVQEIINRHNENISLEDMAVIYRTHKQARPIVRILIENDIPFYLRNGLTSLYDEDVTKDILSYLYLAQGIDMSKNACRILNKPSRFISKVKMDKASHLDRPFLEGLLTCELNNSQKNHIKELMRHLTILKQLPLSEAISYIYDTIGYKDYLEDYAQHSETPIESLLELIDEIEESTIINFFTKEHYQTVQEWEKALIKEKDEIDTSTKETLSDALNLMTMHGSKGLEFDTVFVLDVVDETVPFSKNVDIEEERRLLYVSMTRAKQQLYLYIPERMDGKLVFPSPFIEVLKEYEGEYEIAYEDTYGETDENIDNYYEGNYDYNDSNYWKIVSTDGIESNCNEEDSIW